MQDRFLLVGRGRLRRCGRALKRLQHAHALQRARIDRQRKGAARAELAGDFHIAAERIGQASGNGQPKAGAAVAAGRRPVHLRERLKQLADLFRGNANARVRNCEPHPPGTVCPRQVGNCHADRAALGELDGVSNQIGEGLTQTDAVGVNDLRERKAVIHFQTQALFFRANLHHGEDVVDNLPQEAVCSVQGQPVGLDPRQVQNVAHQFQQGLAISLNPGKKLALFLIGEVGGCEQFAEAKNRRHRSADLMAHVGEKLALGAICRLGGDLRVDQTLFGLLPLLFVFNRLQSERQIGRQFVEQLEFLVVEERGMVRVNGQRAEEPAIVEHGRSRHRTVASRQRRLAPRGKTGVDGRILADAGPPLPKGLPTGPRPVSLSSQVTTAASK